MAARWIWLRAPDGLRPISVGMGSCHDEWDCGRPYTDSEKEIKLDALVEGMRNYIYMFKGSSIYGENTERGWRMLIHVVVMNTVFKLIKVQPLY